MLFARRDSLSGAAALLGQELPFELGRRHISSFSDPAHPAFAGESISKSFLVKNSTRPVATAAGFLPGKSWLARGIDTGATFGIHCCSRLAPARNNSNV